MNRQLKKELKYITLVLSLFISFMTLFNKWYNTEEIIVSASEIIPTTSPTPAPTPKCKYLTPHDRTIEEVFKDQSCNAKAVLKWKDTEGRTYGENGRYKVDNVDVVQNNGSVDRGLFRINSDTFNDYMKRMPSLLKSKGITKWDDMNDLTLNTNMARVVYDYQGWCAWFASPNDLCKNNYQGIIRQL